MPPPASYQNAEEMTLRDYAGVVRRRKWMVVIPVVVVTLIALATSMLQSKQYTASTEVLIKEPPSATSIGAPERPMQQRVLQNELQRAEGSAIRDQVRALIGPEPLIRVRLAGSDDVDVFIFTAVSTNPELASAAANAYADVYITERRASLTVDLAAQASVLADQLTEIDRRLAESGGDEQAADLQLQRDSFSFQRDQLQTSIDLAQQSGAIVIDAAPVPTRAFAPTPRRTAILGLIAGLLIGVAAALVANYFDNALRDESDLAAATGLPVLGVIPRLRGRRSDVVEVVTQLRPSSATAEAYRAFRTAVHFMCFEKGLKVIQVTSPQPGDGKTTTSANLAVASARAGEKVLLIDCDLRRPRLHCFFDLSNSIGFTTLLVGGTLDEVAQKVDGEPNLTVISSGPILPDPAELLAGATAKRFISSTRENFDLVIIDSPPVLAVADPLVLSATVDGVILVASASQSDRRDVARAVEQLQQLDTTMIGTVLNSFDVRSSSDGYRHTYGVYQSAER